MIFNQSAVLPRPLKYFRTENYSSF